MSKHRGPQRNVIERLTAEGHRRVGLLDPGALRRELPAASLLAGLLSLALVVGRAEYEDGTVADMLTSPEAAVRFVAYLLAGLPLFLAAFCLLGAREARGASDALAGGQAAARQPSPTVSKWAIALAGVILFLSWMPVLLAFWPGIFSYDLPYQTSQVMSGGYTRLHPPLHTFFWAFCIRLEFMGFLRAPTTYTLLQALGLSVSCCALLSYLNRKGVGRLGLSMALFFYAADPVMALFACNPTKDVPLAMAMIPLAIETCELTRDPSSYLGLPRRCAAYVLLATLCCLLRNNFPYAFLAFGLVAVVALRPHARRLVPLFVLPLVLWGMINGPVYDSLGVGPGSMRESLSVPLQQVACVASRHQGELSAEELACIGSFLPVSDIAHDYNPRFADPVKDHVDRNEGMDARGFLMAWLRLGLHHPIDYLDAFLQLNLQSWLPGIPTFDSVAQRIYIETESPSLDFYPHSYHSKAPALQSAYREIAHGEVLDRLPILGSVFSLWMPFWLLLTTFAWLASRRSARREWLVVILPLLLWGTHLLGPVANMRYAFPLFTLYPLLAGLLLHRRAILGTPVRARRPRRRA